MASRDGRNTLNPPRSLFERFRPAPAGPGAPNLISTLQAYGGLQAWAARAHRPSQSLGRIGSLEVRLAQTAAEVRQAQKLRYRVFYQEGSAIPNPGRLFARRDVDSYDAICDHLLVLDHAAPDGQPANRPAVVGTYRLLRQPLAEEYGGFYTSGEFDIGGLIARHQQSAIPRARPLLRAGALSQQAHGRTAVARHPCLCDAEPHRRDDRLRQPRRHRSQAARAAAVVPASLCAGAGSLARARAAASAMSR